MWLKESNQHMNEILMNCDYLVISELSSHANKKLQNSGKEGEKAERVREPGISSRLFLLTMGPLIRQCPCPHHPACLSLPLTLLIFPLLPPPPWWSAHHTDMFPLAWFLIDLGFYHKMPCILYAFFSLDTTTNHKSNACIPPLPPTHRHTHIHTHTHKLQFYTTVVNTKEWLYFVWACLCVCAHVCVCMCVCVCVCVC